jgi:Integrase zinc binding domain
VPCANAATSRTVAPVRLECGQSETGISFKGTWKRVEDGAGTNVWKWQAYTFLDISGDRCAGEHGPGPCRARTECGARWDRDLGSDNVRVIRLPGQADRIVAPRSVRDALLRSVHGNPLVGHWGVERSYRKMSEGWWWPRMREYIEEKIKTCVPCSTQRLRPKRQARMVQYHP